MIFKRKPPVTITLDGKPYIPKEKLAIRLARFIRNCKYFPRFIQQKAVDYLYENTDDLNWELAQAIVVPIIQLVRDQSLARQLFAVEPMDEGARAAYPISDDFEAPIFVLPKSDYREEDDNE